MIAAHTDLHNVVLRAPRFLGGGDAPAILRLNEQRFIPALFDALRDPEARAALVHKRIPADDPTLYLPVHRTFNVVVAEAVCDVPGRPRVDPKRIESAGLVLRRRLPSRTTRGAKSAPQRWVSHENTILGWQGVDAPNLDDDPDAKRRPRVSAGHRVIETALAKRRPADSALTEKVTRLYVAPPDVCAAAGATILFGVVETAAPERTERPRRAPPASAGALADSHDPPPGYTPTELRSMIPAWLRATTPPPSIPYELRGRTFRVVNTGGTDLLALEVQRLEGNTWLRTEVPSAWTPLGSSIAGSLLDFRHFVRMLSQLRLQWDVWGQGGEALRSTLRGTRVDLPGGGSTSLDDLLASASRVFVLMEEGATVQFPETWPTISETVGTTIQGGVQQAASARLDQFIRHEGRFDRPEGRYHVRAFVRVKRHPGCAPDLVWSANTPEYRVARWYDGAPDGAVLPTIELPTIDRNFLKKLRPNVSLKVPRSLFNFLQNNTPEDFLDGKAKNDTSGPTFQWICGFNISIIFMIAFMLLISFVFLLNIVFWWVPFFRICIPVPAGLFQDEEAA